MKFIKCFQNYFAKTDVNLYENKVLKIVLQQPYCFNLVECNYCQMSNSSQVFLSLF